MWTSFHMPFCVEIARQLTPKLLPKYAAIMEKRFIATTFAPDYEGGEPQTRPIYPDAVLTRESGETAPRGVVIAAPLQLSTVIPEKVPHATVEIIEIEGRKVVTVIELLSPTNKKADGRAEYLRKRNDVLLSKHHLIEIDLVRGGERVPMRQPLPSVPYFVMVSRAEKRPVTEVWPIPLRSPLPTIPVPLLHGDPDVPLDLQLALDATYDAFGFVVTIRYDRRLNPPLSPEDEAWVVERLAALGKR